jgi:hypothetical protein
MTPRSWLNLGLAGLLLFYAIYFAWQALPHMTCGRIGADYCAYVSAGRVANAYGYAGIYDLQLVEQAQSGMLPAAQDAPPIPVLPFLYLPIFVLPFQLFSQLTPESGFWIWTALNITALFAYLQFFIRRLHLRPAPIRLLLMLFACLPVYMNVLTGQMDIWLVICVGEFMRALFGHEPFRAGLWLGGLLLKPQVLILIGMILLLRRSWQILAGLAASSCALAIVSFILVRPAGLVQMLKAWLTTAGGQANIWVEGMMNWRMLGVHVSNITSPAIGWGWAGAGMLATVVVTLLVWRRPFSPALPSFPLPLLGILAATAMVAWHAHIHMAVILIPPVLYLYQTKTVPQKALDYWVFLPAFLFLVMVFVPETMVKLDIVSGDIRPFIYFAIGAGQFSANLYLFWWAVVASRPGSQALAKTGQDRSLT